MLDADIDDRPLVPLESTGGLVEPEPPDRHAADADDPVARFQAGVGRGAAPDHADEAKSLVVVLEFDPQAHEIPVDHGEHIVEFVGGQIGGVLIEDVAGPEDELQDDRGGGDACGQAGLLANLIDLVPRRVGVGNDQTGVSEADLVAKPGELVGRGAGSIELEEGEVGVAEGDFEVVETTTDQRFEGNRIDVVGFDPLDHFVEEGQRLLAIQAEQDVPEALIAVAAGEPEVHLAETEALLEVVPAGPLEVGVAINLNGGGPEVVPLEGEGPLHRPVGVVLDGDLRSLGGDHGGRFQGLGACRWPDNSGGPKKEQEQNRSKLCQALHRGRPSHGGASRRSRVQPKQDQVDLTRPRE